MRVVSRTLFMLAIFLLSQRDQASGPISAVVLPLFNFQQVEKAVQLQVAFELI